MTIRTCSRSAACADEKAVPKTSMLASENALIDWDIRDPFWEGRHPTVPPSQRLRSRMVSRKPTNRCLAGSRSWRVTHKANVRDRSFVTITRSDIQVNRATYGGAARRRSQHSRRKRVASGLSLHHVLGQELSIER